MTNQAKVGIFSTISIVIFILGFYFLKGTNLFVRKNVYYAVYDRVDGLYKSNLVDVSGFAIGRVGVMTRNPLTGKIVVALDLDKGIQLPKSEATIASILSTDFLGSKKVSIVFGESNEFYKDGDTINTYFKEDLTEKLGKQIDPIMGQVNNILPGSDTTIDGIKYLYRLQKPKVIYTTLGGVNSALDKMNVILTQNQKTIQLTLANLESITNNVQKSNAQITHILKNAEGFTDYLQQANVKQTVQNLNNVLAGVSIVMNDINAGKGTLGKVIKSDELYIKVDSAVASLNALMKDMKQRPYRYITVNVLGSKKIEDRREKKYNESGK